MKINWKILQRDGFDNIMIPQAPTLIRKACQHIIEILERTPPFEYNSMSKLDKLLLYSYWVQIDGMEEALNRAYTDPGAFYKWFTARATSPEDISRARRWLVEHNYVIVKARIGKLAIEAGQKYRSTF